jgi:hypothetical protein
MENMDFLAVLRSIWMGLILFSVLLAIPSFFWGFVDLIALMRYEGKIKRGIKVWSKPLADELRKYLLSLSNPIIETRKNWFFETKIGFIRVENYEALIFYRRPHWGTSWPYVGYVNLSEADSILEFRSSLPMHLFLLPFILSGVGIPFVLLLMVYNYYMESTAIENSLKQKIAEKRK